MAVGVREGNGNVKMEERLRIDTQKAVGAIENATGNRGRELGAVGAANDAASPSTLTATTHGSAQFRTGDLLRVRQT